MTKTIAKLKSTWEYVTDGQRGSVVDIIKTIMKIIQLIITAISTQLNSALGGATGGK